VNQRDLRTFEVDHRRALELGEMMPDGVVSVAESGIRDSSDVRRLADAGYQAVLVGETLVRAGDRRAAVHGLLGAGTAGAAGAARAARAAGAAGT
jgi:indole-3-glycerol phosphate synthase